MLISALVILSSAALVGKVKLISANQGTVNDVLICLHAEMEHLFGLQRDVSDEIKTST